MNLKEIRDDVRSLIVEPAPGFRSDQELNRWINQAHQELGMFYRIEEFVHVQLQPGVTFYDVPEGLIRIRGAWMEDGTSVPTIPVTSGTDLASENDGLTIFQFGEKFVIVPAPGAEENDPEDAPTILLFYERKPRQLLTDDDEPEIATPYHRYLVAYAAMRAFEKDEDYEAAAIYYDEYEKGKTLITQHKVPISQDANIVLELVRAKVLNAAEAAEWLNIPMKRKVKRRVEVEEKGIALLQMGVIDRADLLQNTEFVDRESIIDRLKTQAQDMIPLPPWEDERRDEPDSD